MSDPSTPVQPDNNWLFQVLGAILAIIGGFFAVIFRLRLEKKQEINYIKVSLVDELHEISSIIEKLKETYRTTNVISNSYLNDLQKNTESFEHHKLRLFLIRDEKLRRGIVAFYKRLNENINESINKVGTLVEGSVGQEHNEIIRKFSAISEEAVSLEAKVNKYKYKVLWIC